MEAFTYQRAPDVASAVKSHEAADDGLYMAGGQTIIPVLKQGLAMPSDVIDLSAITGLGGIEVSSDAVTIGAMTRHAEVAASAEIASAIAALATLAGGIGDPQVRNQGTIGGSLANNDPSADYPAAALALGATIKTNTREIGADEYFVDLFETALEEGELIEQIVFPTPKRAAYAKFPNPASRYALVGVFVADTASGVRVAVTGAGQSGVFRAEQMETALGAQFDPAALDGLRVDPDEMITDMHGAGDYRAHLVTVMAKRAVAHAQA